MRPREVVMLFIGSSRRIKKCPGRHNNVEKMKGLINKKGYKERGEGGVGKENMGGWRGSGKAMKRNIKRRPSEKKHQG